MTLMITMMVLLRLSLSLPQSSLLPPAKAGVVLVHQGDHQKKNEKKQAVHLDVVAAGDQAT